ncbi:MAG TPA: PfkB family carbohydrate kinase [Rhodocyclaceae bacterium]|nr:PfkB family carbohydrate kinase [Rhodocyclaceae bacterium]
MDHPPQLLVFGEALVDRFADAVVPGGAPFNVARHLSALGLPLLLLTRVGADNDASAIRSEINRYDLSPAGVQIDPVLPTGCVDVTESAPGRHSFHIAPVSAYDFYDEEALYRVAPLTPLWQVPSPVSAVYYGTLALRHPQSRQACYRVQDRVGGQRFLDFNWREGHVSQDTAWEAFCRADMAKLNDEELSMLLSWRGLASPWREEPPSEGVTCNAIAALLGESRIKKLVVTYGAAGYGAFSDKGTCIARGRGLTNVRLVDTVGAGDAFAAITLLGDLLAWPLKATLQRANEFAAAMCGQRGAVPDSIDFYASWKSRWQLSPTPIPAGAGHSC